MSRPQFRQRNTSPAETQNSAAAAFLQRRARRGRDWCSRLRTADDIASARQTLTTWAGRTGNTALAESMAEDITKRAITLGLEDV